MNVYKVITPAISAFVFAEDANAAIECFVDEFVGEYFNLSDSDINCVEQIASEHQPRCFKSDFPSRLIVSLDGVKELLERNGYKVTRKDE